MKQKVIKEFFKILKEELSQEEIDAFNFDPYNDVNIFENNQEMKEKVISNINSRMKTTFPNSYKDEFFDTQAGQKELGDDWGMRIYQTLIDIINKNTWYGKTKNRYNPEVFYIQTGLAIIKEQFKNGLFEADADYWNKTRKVVSSFQTIANISIDGVFGKEAAMAMLITFFNGGNESDLNKIDGKRIINYFKGSKKTNFRKPNTSSLVSAVTGLSTSINQTSTNTNSNTGQNAFASAGASVFPIPSSYNGKSIYMRVTSKPQKVRKLAIYATKKSHRGIDYGIIVNTPLVSISDGVVIMNRDRASQGSKKIGYIIVEYPGIKVIDDSPTYRENNAPNREGNLMVAYMHIRKSFVKEGDNVSAGQVIALSGGKAGDLGSGLSTGPHLHLGIGARDKNHPFGDIFTPDGLPGQGGFNGSISGELYDLILGSAQKIEITDEDMPGNIKQFKNFGLQSENKKLRKSLNSLLLEQKSMFRNSEANNILTENQQILKAFLKMLKDSTKN